MTERGEDRATRDAAAPPASAGGAAENPYESPTTESTDEFTHGGLERPTRLRYYALVLGIGALPLLFHALMAFQIQRTDGRSGDGGRWFIEGLAGPLVASIVLAVCAAGFALERARRNARRYANYRLMSDEAAKQTNR